MIVKYINYSGYMPYLVMIAIVFAISSLTFLSLNIVQAKFVMIHTILVTAYFSLGILSAGASAIFLFNVNSGPELMTIGIIEAALGVILLLAMFNPRLRTWANLETIKNEDGSMSVVRPKFFILAFSEWLAIFLHLAIQIVFLVSYLWY
jgi:hypothetical protein